MAISEHEFLTAVDLAIIAHDAAFAQAMAAAFRALPVAPPRRPYRELKSRVDAREEARKWGYG